MKFKLFTHIAVLVLFTIGCNDPKNEKQETVSTQDDASTEISKQNFCFIDVYNYDTTFVSLEIDGNTITGTMDWIPFQKDGARGTLSGTKNPEGELELIYDYVIEGSEQSETKIMKIENGKLMIKVGELVDTDNDGNLRYKDVSTAEYTDTLSKVDCD